MIDRSALEAALGAAEAPELLALAGELQGRAWSRLTPAAQVKAEPLIDSEAAAKLLGVSAYYVEQLARERRIPCVRPPGTARAGRKREGRMVRFRAADLTAWAEAHLDSGWDKSNGR
jgi:excisionase family DNA binding protein